MRLLCLLLVMFALTLHSATAADEKKTNETVVDIKLPERVDNEQCSLFCYILPQRNERVDFTQFHSNLSCTHFVYGFGDLFDDLGVYGPSTEDFGDSEFPGNFYFLRKLKALHKDKPLFFGVNLENRDVLMSVPHQRAKMARILLQTAGDMKADGLFFRIHRQYIDNHFLKLLFMDLNIQSNWKVPLAAGVDLNLATHALRQLVASEPYLQTIHLLSNPPTHRIENLDALLPSNSNPPEKTISYHAQALASAGIPKMKIIAGLSVRSVVYSNLVEGSLAGEAQGRLEPVNTTCHMYSPREVDTASASENFRWLHQWITSNGINETSIGRKVRWLTSSGFGGIGLQGINYDDPTNNCTLGPFPLTKIASDNLHCTVRPNGRARACTRLCYVFSNAESFKEKLPSTACSHIVVEAEITAHAEVRLTSSAVSVAKWLRQWKVADRPRLIISLGPRLTSDVWRIAIAFSNNREKIATQLRALLQEWQGVGAEISWTLGTMNIPTDSKNYKELLVEVKDTFNETGFKLLAAVTHTDTYDKHYDEVPLNETVDYLVLHTHRFHSAQMVVTGHPSPLFYHPDLLPEVYETLNVRSFVDQWLSRRMPRNKIIIGITAQPMSMMLMDATERAAPAEMPEKPAGMKAKPSNPFVQLRSDDRINDGRKVCEAIKSGKGRVRFLTELGVPFMVNDQLEFVAYENERSVQMKSTWASLEELGGVALFNMELDNPQGVCPERPFNLLHAIADTQVCEHCIHVDDVTPCDTTFVTSCSYRLTTAEEKNPMPPSKIPFEQCTRIVVEEAILNEKAEITFRDAHAEKAMLNLTQHLPKIGMKRLIASVHCEMSKEKFQDMLRNGKNVTQTLLDFVQKNKFSGIELKCDDLLEPVHRVPFMNLLSALKEGLIAITPPQYCPYSLSLRLPVWKRELEETYDIQTLNSLYHVVLEPFNDPAREESTHLNSPLFPSNGHDTDIHTTVSAWLKQGVERPKILVQIPSYSTMQEIVANTSGVVGAAAKNGQILNQAQVCAKLSQKGTTQKQIWDRMAMYAETADRKWISSQNQDTISYKIFYAIREGLGGIGLLSLNEDDWEGSCHQLPFPLLNAAKARCSEKPQEAPGH